MSKVEDLTRETGERMLRLEDESDYAFFRINRTFKRVQFSESQDGPWINETDPWICVLVEHVLRGAGSHA